MKGQSAVHQGVATAIQPLSEADGLTGPQRVSRYAVPPTYSSAAWPMSHAEEPESVTASFPQDLFLTIALGRCTRDASLTRCHGRGNWDDPH